MKELLKTWRLRMVKYRQEADNAKSPITRVKAMNKFFIYRDCIKELEQAINYTHCCESDSELFTPNDVKLPKENKPISMHTDSKKPLNKKV